MSDEIVYSQPMFDEMGDETSRKDADLESMLKDEELISQMLDEIQIDYNTFEEDFAFFTNNETDQSTNKTDYHDQNAIDMTPYTQLYENEQYILCDVCSEIFVNELDLEIHMVQQHELSYGDVEMPLEIIDFIDLTSEGEPMN